MEGHQAEVDVGLAWHARTQGDEVNSPVGHSLIAIDAQQE
jgi:hypothetical protein